MKVGLSWDVSIKLYTPFCVNSAVTNQKHLSEIQALILVGHGGGAKEISLILIQHGKVEDYKNLNYCILSAKNVAVNKLM